MTTFRSRINQPDVKRHSGLGIITTSGIDPFPLRRWHSLHYYFHPIIICSFTLGQAGAGDGKATGNNWVSKLPWPCFGYTKYLSKGGQILYTFATGGLALPIHVSGKQHRTVLWKTRLTLQWHTYLTASGTCTSPISSSPIETNWTSVPLRSKKRMLKLTLIKMFTS